MCYFKPARDRLISNTTITEAFLNGLAKHADVISIPTRHGLPGIDIGAVTALNADYVLVDILNFGIGQFVLRERHGLDIPFILILHTVYHWFVPLVHIIPLIRTSDVVIAPSVYAKKSFMKISGRVDVKVVPYSLDLSHIRQIAKKPHDCTKRMCFMGRLTESKGIEFLIDCMPEIAARAKDVELNVIGPLSGDGTGDQPKSRFVEKLLQKVNRGGLMGKVAFLGMKLGKDKYEILTQGDVFVSPTTYRGEVFGVSMIEALACGLPVIATRWAANAEIVQDGITGCLVDIKVGRNGKVSIDREQLISSVTNVLADPRRLATMRTASVGFARRYDCRMVAQQLIRLLKKHRSRAAMVENWDSLKTKRVIDFSGHYDKEILPFIDFFCARDTTYLNIYNAPDGEAVMVLCNRKNFAGTAETNRLTQQMARKLFWHLYPKNYLSSLRP